MCILITLLKCGAEASQGDKFSRKFPFFRNAHSAGKKPAARLDKSLLKCKGVSPHKLINERSFEESCGQDARAPRGRNSTVKLHSFGRIHPVSKF